MREASGRADREADRRSTAPPARTAQGPGAAHEDTLSLIREIFPGRMVGFAPLERPEHEPDESADAESRDGNGFSGDADVSDGVGFSDLHDDDNR